MNDNVGKALDAIMAVEQQLLADGVDLESILNALQLRALALQDEVDGPDGLTV